MGNQVRIGDVLSDPLIRLTGQPFLDELVRRQRNRFNASYVWIGRLFVDGAERVKIIASASAPGLAQIEDYPIYTTPCEATLPGATSNPQEIYVSVPLYDSCGSVIGVFGICRRYCTEDESAVVRALSDFSDRIGVELERLEREEVSRALSLSDPLDSVWSSANAKGPERLCAGLAEEFAARFAFFAEVAESDGDQIRVIASSINGKTLSLPNAALKAYINALNDHRLTNDAVLFKSGLLNVFPDDRLLQNNSIDSYVGKFLKDDQGNIIGHFALMHDMPFDPGIVNSPELEAFGHRALLELEQRLTERRRRNFENEFLNKRKKERIGLMLGTIAHDFNNALVGILGNALLASGDPLTSQHSRQCISNIEDGVIKARALVYQALNFLGHDHEPARSLSDVGAVLREAVGFVPQGPGVGAKIKLGEIQNDLQAVIEPTKLAQLIVYLLLNAQEAIGGDAGVVEIKVLRRLLAPQSREKMLLCPESLPSDVIAIDVSDNGAGLAKGELARISDPFFRTKSKGRGLGLAAAQGIIKAHGGGLSVSSRMGRGTRVRIYLPFDNNKGARIGLTLSKVKHKQETTKAPSGTSCRLLVIDDQEEICQILANQLEGLGYCCSTASSGAQGLEYVKEDPELKAALIDLTMPDMDGWQTLEALRLQRPDLPVVIMSGATDAQTVKRAHESGQGVYFLAKPFRRQSLVSILYEALANKVV